ncbi:hypothetical protein ISG29_09300 [Nocardioides sp. CBS4Y-1]|uniref:DUF6752 domain-containing protein n=1 Tax=Nocardioides acrostichi TaxID=2784339 RepID=A0A930Y7C5_9ACTN|nr:hypothetical protein [Nocardioides acrostichi]
MREKLPTTLAGGRVAELTARVEQLEADLAELRRHQLRMAELADIVTELLVPMASRDDAAVAAALEKFQAGL